MAVVFAMSCAAAQTLGTCTTIITIVVGTGRVSCAPPACAADGRTSWSNACDIPVGVALGVL